MWRQLSGLSKLISLMGSVLATQPIFPPLPILHYTPSNLVFVLSTWPLQVLGFMFPDMGGEVALNETGEFSCIKITQQPWTWGFDQWF